MKTAKNIIIQIAAYISFAVFIGYFSSNPGYIHLDPDMALLKISFSHAGQRKEECRRLTQEELEALAPNMRRPLECSRERVPILVEVLLDGKILYKEYIPPSGLSHDGTSTVYERFRVTPGQHKLVTRMRDSRENEGFDFERSADIELKPGQNFVIDFNKESGGFVFL